MTEALEQIERARPHRFRPYPHYKDSGVEWLGEIPAHWEVRRLKYVAPVTDERVHGGSADQPYVALDQIESWTGRLRANAEPQQPESTTTKFREGDVLFGKLRPYLAKVVCAGFAGHCSTELLVLRPSDSLDPKMLSYELLSEGFIRWIDSLTYGTKMPRANPSDVERTPAAIPRPREQSTIVAFLDRETAKIDALVAKKERLCELLQEKRTALITRAVTKGLDPTVPMKDSGVEWLGEMPAHWRVLALKRIGDLQAGAGFPEGEQGVLDEELPFFKVGDMAVPGNERELQVWQHSISRATAKRLRAFIFPPGAVVFAKVGAALLLNRRRLLAVPSCLDNNMMGFMPEDCDSAWTMYWLSGLDMSELANPGAVPSVNEGQMRETPALVPPLEEQRAIAAFLDRETAKIDTLISKVREAIERLKEYRTALISAAVTGKIDVREEVPG